MEISYINRQLEVQECYIRVDVSDQKSPRPGAYFLLYGSLMTIFFYHLLIKLSLLSVEALSTFRTSAIFGNT